MPLFINGEIVDVSPPETKLLYQIYTQCKELTSAFCAQPLKVVGSVGLLYVAQREYAITVPHDKNITVLGTDDATTCHMAVVRHSGSGVVGVAHFDNSDVEEGVANMLSRIQQLSVGFPDNRIELHLIGGYKDAQGYSAKLSFTLLEHFHRQPVQIDLITACIGELNSTFRGGIHWPIIYGVGVNVKTGEVFPATFSDKGPDIPLRSARNLTGSPQTLDIYDCTLGLLRIGPFNYGPMRGVDLWLQQNDDFILQHLSTSPEVEPPHFVAHMRATLKHIQQHPFPAVTVFPENRPHFFRKDESGEWILLHY